MAGRERPLILLGTGGSALDVLDIVDALNARTPMWKVAGFLDDAQPKGTQFLGHEILGRLADASQFAEAWFLNTIGSDRSFRQRPRLIESTRIPTERFATLIHPQASVSGRATLGAGVYVNPGVVIAGNVKIGNHVSLCPGCILGHDAMVDDYAVLAPGAVVSGFVHIGACSYLGGASVIRQRVRIGAQALVGMGAVVLRDVGEGATVIGNPGRILAQSIA